MHKNHPYDFQKSSASFYQTFSMFLEKHRYDFINLSHEYFNSFYTCC